MRIAFFEVKDWEKEYIKHKLKGHKTIFFNKEANNKTIQKIKNVDAVAVFIYSKIDKKVLDKLKKLRLITTMSTGFEHIDIEECKKRNIDVCNVPLYGENTVAEHTFGMILALSRKIHKIYERTIKGDFSLEGLMGFDLRGKTIGIVGVGNIGEHVARIAKGLEMNVLAFDKKKNKGLAKRIGFRYVSFDYLLKNSDIITLHVPLNKYTHHMINKQSIKKMKKGIMLINTSRGEVVDTDALIYGLNNSIVSYAGLDVLEGEELIKEEKQLLSKRYPLQSLKTLIKNHYLLRQDNVLITPHNAFNSKEALQRIMDTTVDNIKAFVKGKPINRVS